MNIVKARIGKCLNLTTNDVRFQLQFKLENQNHYNGFSVDNFETESEAKQALSWHNDGSRVYKPFSSLGTMKGYIMCKATTKL